MHYYAFSDFLKKFFGHPVQKISLYGGFTCPNRDGTKGNTGCTFCNNEAFSPSLRFSHLSIREQIQHAINNIQKRRPNIHHFIAYFQAYSNTYGPPEKLHTLYQEVTRFPEIVGIAVGTRCDCLSDPILAVISEWAQKIHFWLEIGLETIHNKTLQRIARGHSYEEFLESYEKVRKIKNLFICLHLIHGLPGEGEEEMLETIKEVNRLKPDAVKFHQLEIVKNTPLEKEWQEKKITLLSPEQYLDILGKSIEILDPSIIIQRLFGFTPPSYRIAPTENIDWNKLLNNYLKQNSIYQGKKFLSP